MQALGATCRRLWRRSDLTDVDKLVCELAAEAVVRLNCVQKGPPDASAASIVALAPPAIQQELALLAGIALRQQPPQQR